MRQFVDELKKCIRRADKMVKVYPKQVKTLFNVTKDSKPIVFRVPQEDGFRIIRLLEAKHDENKYLLTVTQ